MSSVLEPASTPSSRPLSGAWRAVVAGLGEGAWMLAALLVAIMAVAFFVLVMELPTLDGRFDEVLQTPVNLVRIGVLASAAWLGSYIHRAVRQVPVKGTRASMRCDRHESR